MLKEVYDLLSELSHPVVKLIAYSIIAQACVSALASWLLWRLWAFTIQPRLRPEEPKELPYWIPGSSSWLLSKYIHPGTNEK